MFEHLKEKIIAALQNSKTKTDDIQALIDCTGWIFSEYDRLTERVAQLEDRQNRVHAKIEEARAEAMK